jgi:hypothetical protein
MWRAVLVALSVAGAAPAAADVRSEAQLGAFIEMLDAAAEWTATSERIRSEGADTIADGVSISRRDPEVMIEIESLRLRDLSEHPEGGGFRASRIEATGIALTSESVAYEIPTATVTDVSMPSFAAVEFDPQQLMTAISQYYSIAARGEVDELVVPELIVLARQVAPGATEPVTSRLVYRNYRMTGFSGGAVEAQEVGPVEGTVSSPGEEEVEIVVDKITVGRTDIGAIARIIDERQYQNGRGDEVWRPVIASVGYSGFSVTAPEGVTFGLTEMAVENIEGRQPAVPFTGDLDRLLDPELSDEAKAEFALEMVSNMYSAWRVGSIRLAGMSVDAPPASTTFSLGNMTLSGLSSDGIESFAIEAFEGTGSGGFAALGSFQLTGLRFPALNDLLKFAALESDAAPAEHAKTVRAAFGALPRLSHLGIHEVSAGQSEAAAVRLDSLTLDFTDWNEIWAGSTDIRLEGLEVPRSLVELNPQASQVMDQLGYDRIVLGMSIEDRWSAGTGTDDAIWRVSMQDAGEIALSYSLVGLTADWIINGTADAVRAADPNAAFMEMLADLAVKSATLKITDRSLLDRGFTVAAKMQGLSVEGPAYREQMRGALPFLLSAAVPAELSKLLSAPLQQFLAGGQTLVAEIAPPQPMPVPELIKAAEGDPLSLPTRLGVTVRSEAPAQ